MSMTIKMPGKFRDWMSGTGIAQGQVDDDQASRHLADAWQRVTWTRAGRGVSGVIVLDDRAAVAVLAEYADAGVAQNADGTGCPAEARASAQVLKRCQVALEESAEREAVAA
jgi:hypothetical protein